MPPRPIDEQFFYHSPRERTLKKATEIAKDKLRLDIVIKVSI